MEVPYLDLRAEHEGLMAQMHEAFERVTEAGAFAGGPFVARFESEFAACCESRFAVGVGSGTDAIWLSLLALGVGPGDEVITVPNGHIGIAEAISLCGARPVFVDIDERTYTMDVSQLESTVTLRTQAIIPVHLYGQVADMDSILAVARRYGTPVIEDAGHAHGAEYKGRKAGSLGVGGCFSFHPGRNLSAIGEAGAIVTDEPELRTRLELLRDHGQPASGVHSTIGWNARMDGIQGAILSLKLKYLHEANELRRVNANLYNELLVSEPKVTCPLPAPGVRHVYHIYAVRVPNRDRVLQRMAARGVECGVHGPPIHLQRAYGFLNLRQGAFPVAERCANELLSLPVYPGLGTEQIHFVAEMLKECLVDEPEVENRSRHAYGRSF